MVYLDNSPDPQQPSFAGIPQSTAPPAGMFEAFGKNPWEADEEAHTRAVNDWRANVAKELEAAVSDPDGYFKDAPLPFARNRGEAITAATNDLAMALHSGGLDIPTGGLPRHLLRQKLAAELFDGRGGDSEQSFHAEIVKASTARKQTTAILSEVSTGAANAAVLGFASPEINGTAWPKLRETLRSRPGYDPAREADYLEAFHQSRKAARERMEPFAPQLAQIWQAMNQGGAGTTTEVIKAGLSSPTVLGAVADMAAEASKRDAGATAFHLYQSIPEDQRPDFMNALGLLARTFPDATRTGFFSNLAKQGGRDTDSLGRGAAEAFLANAVSSMGAMPLSISAPGAGNLQQMSQPQADAARAEYMARRNFAADVRRIEQQDFNPMKSAWGNGKPGMVETGFYGIPGALASTAEAAVPFIGWQLSYLSMQGQAYDQLRDQLKTAGMADKEASEFADRWAPLAAVPQAALEKLQAGAWAGKLPGVQKAMDAAGDLIKNRPMRLGARTVIGATGETVIETVQDGLLYAAQDIGAALEDNVPAVRWTGTGGALDGFWTQTGSTFVSMLPLAIIGAAGGLNREARARAFADASSVQRLALGITPEHDAAIEAAAGQGPSTLSRAVDQALLDRDATSESAKAATAQLEKTIQSQLKATESLKSSGLLPDIVVSAGGFQVRDPETGEIIGTAKDTAGAMKIASAHSAAMDDASSDMVSYLMTSMEAAQAAVSLDPQSKVSVELSKVMTEATQAAEDPSSIDRFHEQQRLRELAQGGTGELADVVLGSSATTFREKVRETANRIFQGGSVLSIFHETAHGLRRAAHAAGVLTRTDDLAMLRAVDSVMAGKSMRRGEQGGRSLRLIPEGMADADVTDTMIDEGVAELIEMEVMRTRAGGKKRPDGHGIPSSVNRIAPGIISRNLSALARLAGDQTVGKWKAFSDAVRGLFGLATQRALALRKAERDGLFDTEAYDAYLDRLTNTSAQRAHEAQAAEVAGEIVAGETPFSIGPRPASIKYLDQNVGKSDSSADEKDRDPASILETITAQSDVEGSVRTDGKKRRKHGRIVATVEDLAKWAEKAGRVLNPEPIQALDEYPSAGGEHIVIFDEPSERVIKLTKPGLFGAQGEDAGAYVKRWALHNLAFGDDVAFEGMVTLPGEDSPRAVISQPFAMGRDATPEEQREYLIEKGFHEAADGRWIHPIRKIVAWDTITPGNAIMTEDGVKFIDLQMAPAPADELAKIQESTGIGRKTAFSIAPSAMVSRLNERAIELIRNPRERAASYQRLGRKLADLRLAFERLELVAGSKRRKASLRKEAAVREALRLEELVNEAWGRHGAILSDDDLTRLKSQPVHELLADPNSKLRGRLMSKGRAMQQQADLFITAKGGEWDGADGISRAVFGGSLLPDQAAQELYDAHLISEPTPDAMWDAIRREQNFVDNMKEALLKAKDELRDAKRQAKQETNEWLKAQDSNQAANFSDKQEILRALAVLDGVLSVVPADIRGKVGGYTQLAALGSNETRLEFLKRRLAMVDAEMEKWLAAQYDREFRELLKRTRPAKEKPGEKPTGTIGADLHEVFRAVEASMGWKPAEVEAEATKLESLAASNTLTAEEEANAITQANLIRLAGNWTPKYRAVLDANGDPTGESVLEYPGADAARREQAVIEAARIIESGYWANRLEAAQKRANRAATRQRLTVATGKAGTQPERVNKALEDQGVKGGRGWRPALSNLYSFEQLLNVCFGEKAEDSRRIADNERWASDKKSDAVFRATNALESLYTELAGGGLAGAELAWKLAQKSMTINGLQLSEMEAIHWTMMWRQEDGQRHMLGHQDDDGNFVGKWHYDQAFVDEMENNLSPEAKQVRLFLSEHYAGEYDRLNPVYRSLNGVNLPRVKMYSPLTVVPQQVKPGQEVDPVTGFAQSGGFTPGSLKNRSQDAIAEPRLMDATQAFIAHVKQIEHWIAYAPLTQEMMQVLGNRDLLASIEARAGKESVNMLSKWMEYFSIGGNRDASAQLGLSQKFGTLTGRAASVALVGRLSVLWIQSTQIFAAIAEMPTGAYLSRLAKLQFGQLGWADAIKSDYIQRRLQQLPPAVRIAVDGLNASKPSQLKHSIAQIGRLIGGFDALFTAGTYAICLDYHRTQARKDGMDAEAAEIYAHQSAQRSCDRVSQPTRAGARSIFENLSTNPMMRVSWAFASEARQKLGLFIYTMANPEATLSQKARVASLVWLVGGLGATMLRSAFRDLRDDEDDEWLDEKNWGVKRLTLSTLTGPLGGIPLIGDILEAGVYKAVGEYLPEGNLFSSTGQAARSARNVPDWFTGDRELGDAIKDMEAILSGMGLFHDGIAAAASLSHLVRDIFGIADNLLE